ncbi:Alpha/Beta hydrolase protein [Thelonectria olida]|uniref:Alpha/Beta hydrolase protein n=1 Tax=Thelonectria olida TaxID=1576542 RepID=A0A9P8W3P7_9HYPO|nr:Alpha/Beta hydrolase protein [Thelonectria olida]
MDAFKLTLPDDTVLSGIHNIPTKQPSPSPKSRPLVVGLHGGCYTSRYFDVTPEYSASLTSSFLSVPFVAIDRPGYKDSTPVTPIPEGSSFPEEWGKRLHQSILPALWAEFGLPNACTCIVLHCHSLGANGALVAASLHATDSGTPIYPLGGIVMSGFGSLLKETGGHVAQPDPPPSHVSIPVQVKDSTLLLPGTADDQVYAESERLDHAMPFDEIAALRGSWLSTWKQKWGANITAPVMIALAERDHYWGATQEHLQDFAAGLPRSIRVDTSIIRAAPHNIELSYWGAGWYARSFGFAIECAVSLVLTI